MLVVVGPCSIHDVEAVTEYAERLKKLSDESCGSYFYRDARLLRKARSTGGWKGLINDPFLDDSFRVAQGLEIGRQLLLDLSEMGLPLATEALDPITLNTPGSQSSGLRSAPARRISDASRNGLGTQLPGRL